MEQVIFQDLGKIDYKQAWDYQQTLLREIVAIKLANRQLIKAGELTKASPHRLLFCEHPPVFTVGRSGSMEHLLLDQATLVAQGVAFYKINRGGDITYHGPGQVVGYPIFDLDCFFTDVHRYVRYLEEAVIAVLADYGLAAERIKGFTGVWLPATEYLPQRKICAIGVHLSRWVTMHGFAFNVNTDLRYFEGIVPCGIAASDKAVTSLHLELGHEVDMTEIKTKLKQQFARLFECKITQKHEERHSPTQS